MSILAQLLGFIVFLFLIFYCSTYVLFVIGSIQIRDDDDDKIFINLLEIITTYSPSQPDATIQLSQKATTDILLAIPSPFHLVYTLYFHLSRT